MFTMIKSMENLLVSNVTHLIMKEVSSLETDGPSEMVHIYIYIYIQDIIIIVADISRL